MGSSLVVRKIQAMIRYMGRFRMKRSHGKWVMAPDYESLQFDAVNIDTNNTCNLRCRFCFNEFDKKPVYMTEEIFRKILPIFSMTRPVGPGGTGVYLSCLYEPTLSPHFFDFIRMLPEEAREKVFFTSNFCKPWSEEQLRLVCGSNLHHINISIETLKADRYKEITGSTQFDSFYKNIHCLADIYGKTEGYRPQIRFITMILNINRDEIAGIVKYCSEKLHSSFHELRTPYISVYENMKWNETQLMEEEECRQIEEELRDLGLPLITDIHSKKDLVTVAPGESDGGSDDGPESERQGGQLAAQQSERQGEQLAAQQSDPLELYFEELRFCMHQEFFFLRFHPSGICTENVTKESYPIENEQDMTSFYKDKIRKLYKRRAAAFACPVPVLKGSAKPVRMKVMIEQMTANEQCLTIFGWYRVQKDIAEGRMLMVQLRMAGTDEKDLFALCQERADLDKGDAEIYGAGFTVCLDRDVVTSDMIELGFSFINRGTMQQEYRYEYPYCIEWKDKHLFENVL